MSRLFIELYLDEDVDVLVADLVRARGFKVTTTQEARLPLPERRKGAGCFLAFLGHPLEHGLDCSQLPFAVMLASTGLEEIESSEKDYDYDAHCGSRRQYY